MLATRTATKTVARKPEAPKVVTAQPKTIAKPQPAKPKGIFDADPEIQKYRKLLKIHNNVVSETSAVNLICEFKPKELNSKKAEELNTLAKMFDKEVKSIAKIQDELKKKPEPATDYDKRKALELFKMGVIFADYSNWIGEKYKEYQETQQRADEQLKLQMDAFKKIYKALYDGESGIFKRSFMLGREWYPAKQLQDELKKDKSERTQLALKLAEKYKDSCKWDNDELFTEIYKYSFLHSGFFSRSCIMGQTIFSTKIIMDYTAIKARAEYITAKPNSRTAKICIALGFALNPKKVETPSLKT